LNDIDAGSGWDCPPARNQGGGSGAISARRRTFVQAGSPVLVRHITAASKRR
jgi:hypothetical protein